MAEDKKKWYEDDSAEEIGYGFKDKRDGDWFLVHVLPWAVAFGFILIYRFFGHLKPLVWDATTPWFLYVIIAYLTVYWMFRTFTDQTPKIIWNHNYSTTTGEFIAAGNWAIFRLGGIKAPLFGYLERNIGIVVIPIETANKFGRSFALAVEGNEISFDELPEKVQDIVTTNRLKPPYLWGAANPEQYTQKAKLEEKVGPHGITRVTVANLISMLREGNKRITFLKDMIKDSGETVEDYVARSARIHERAKGPLLDRTKKKFFGE
jgi:hypothetical protein